MNKSSTPNQTKKVIAGTVIGLALLGGGIAVSQHAATATTQSQAVATPAPATTSSYQAPTSAVS